MLCAAVIAFGACQVRLDSPEDQIRKLVRVQSRVLEAQEFD
jgi:hypothetical protein